MEAEPVNKIATGIPGMDEILGGGIRENSTVLLTGAPGTGKSIFALQFIVEGAKKGEPGIFITTDETLESTRSYAESIGLELEKYEKKGLITLIRQIVTTKKLVTIATPLDIIRKHKVKRVVLDSLSLFELTHVAGIIDYRKELLNFLLRMKEIGVTLLATAEMATTNIDVLTYRPEDFLFEGVVLFTKIRKGASFERCITVAKMRGQEHSINIYPFKIGKGGITVFPHELPFSLIEKDVKKEK